MEAEMEQLKWRMDEVRDTAIVEYKESVNYRTFIGIAAIRFLTKERIKMRRLLRRLHNIEDMSFLEDINMESTFFNTDRDRKEEEKEVEQEEPLSQSLLG